MKDNFSRGDWVYSKTKPLELGPAIRSEDGIVVVRFAYEPSLEDAVLMSASKDMLYALQEAIELVNHNGVRGIMLEAIRKATGEKQ